MNRSRAALRHLWPSILVLAVIACLVVFAWYPNPLLQFTDSGKFSILLIICAALIGPALTWVVYKKGKRGLLLDLVVIVLIQLIAIGWGTGSLYLQRPYFMVFALDRFDVLSLRDVDVSSIENPQFRDKPFTGPILLYANMPSDSQGMQKLLREVMFEGKPDIQFRPESWSLYSEKQQFALEPSQPLLMLRNARPGSTVKIDNMVNKHGGDIVDLNFVPAMMHAGHFAAILDADSGELVDMLMIDPWLNQ
jgi:hypothetical protein